MKMKKRWLLPLMLVLVLSLAITGCTTDDPDAVDDTQTGESEEVEDKVEDAADDVGDAASDVEDDIRDMTYEDITVTPEEAFDKFMELHPDAKVNQVDLDKELMEYQYVIEGYDTENDYEVKINPVDGEVISDDTEVAELDDDAAVEITKDHVAKVDSIIDTAKEEDGSDSELDEWNIYTEDGKVIMDVEIGMTEYSYDMDTEQLLENEM